MRRRKTRTFTDYLATKPPRLTSFGCFLCDLTFKRMAELVRHVLSAHAGEHQLDVQPATNSVLCWCGQIFRLRHLRPPSAWLDRRTLSAHWIKLGGPATHYLQLCFHGDQP